MELKLRLLFNSFTIAILCILPMHQVFAMAGGTPAQPSDPIFQSSVFIKRVYKIQGQPDNWAICSGTILDNRHILTASHCLANGEELDQPIKDIRDIYLVFGNPTAIESPELEKRPVAQFFIHPQYAGFRKNQYGTKELNDIAIIQFEGGLPPGFRAIQILSNEEELVAGAQVGIAGYGRSFNEDYDGPFSLKHMQVQVKGLENLPLRYADNYRIKLPPFKSKQRIELSFRPEQRMTHGDSGGPGYFIKNGQVFQWGIASSGYVYEMIQPHLIWIQKVLTGK